MDKKIKTILAVIVIAVVVVSALLFFVVFRDDKSKFIGTWVEIEGTTPASIYTENFSYPQTFYDNNSVKIEVINKSTEEILDTSWWIYKVEFGKFYLGTDEDQFKFSEPCYYTFSDDYAKLTLTLQSDPDEYWIYSKIS